MRFLVDAQLPPALARWIESRGYMAEHVHEFAPIGASDRAIWEYAGANNAVIVSKDEDFFVLKSMQPDGPTVVWIRIGNTRKVELLRWFESLFPAIVSALERGEKIIEIS
ncbi:MAG: hypothetical protein FD130_429 [Halothiobacillaceae bacterium]|nr:MAG: hypothetical protein FD130_429 [Halothiobacillaceae bacterium]